MGWKVRLTSFFVDIVSRHSSVQSFTVNWNRFLPSSPEIKISVRCHIFKKWAILLAVASASTYFECSWLRLRCTTLFTFIVWQVTTIIRWSKSASSDRAGSWENSFEAMIFKIIFPLGLLLIALQILKFYFIVGTGFGNTIFPYETVSSSSSMGGRR